MDSVPVTEKNPAECGPRTFAILALALVARLLVLCFAITHFPHNWLFSRGIELGTLAQSLLLGRGLSSPFYGSTGPTALLAPGYPFFIACIFRIFGSFTFAAAIAVMVMQVFFSVITVLVIILVAHRLFGSTAANLAGVFWALSLPLIWMPTIFWETCLSTLALIGIIALALRCERKPSLLLCLLLGIGSGVVVLVNPALMFSLLAILAWTIWRTKRSLLYGPVLSLLLFVLVYAPWPIRNARVLHAFIPLRSTVGFELWVGNRAGADGFLDESQFPLFNKHEYDDYVAKGEVVYMRDKSTLAKDYVLSHPREFLRLTVVRVFRFWTGTGSKDGSLVFVLDAVSTTFLALAGIWRLLRQHRFSLAVLFILPLALFPLPYYITHAEFRYRLVVDPLLTILAAYAVSGWLAHSGKVTDPVPEARLWV